jgi:phosphatidylserine/phosphatidylglycerophosphate/cardiolipin synthase-like enzyme
MKPEEFEKLLSETFEDRHLSRKESQALRQRLQEANVRPEQRGDFRRRAFEKARQAISSEKDQQVLEWLEAVIKVLIPRDDEAAESRAFFSSQHHCQREIVRLLDASQKRVEICVFAISDDEIRDAILRAHERGVNIRIITDDQKSKDKGADAPTFKKAKIPVRFDSQEQHMHHKFAIFDDTTLLTGSHNWTWSAAKDNEENFLVTEDRDLVNAYRSQFDRLWNELG